MIYNTNEQTGPQTVGGFQENSNAEFSNTLATLQEAFHSKNLEYCDDIKTICKNGNLLNDYNKILFEDYMTSTNAIDPGMHQRNCEKLTQLVENSREALLENSLTANLNPVVGLTFPLLKKYWINNVFKDFVPTEIATMQTVKIGIENIFIQDSKGKKHYLPEALEDETSEALLVGSLRAPLTDKAITVPQVGYDLITESGGSTKQHDTISKKFHIDTVVLSDGSNDKEVKNLRIEIEPGTGLFYQEVSVETAPGTPEVKDSQGKVTTAAKPATVVKDIIQGSLDFETGLLNVACFSGKVKSIKVKGFLSSENNLRTASMGWDKQIKTFVIPDAEHLNTGLTEERIHDDKVMYNVDTTAKAISDMTTFISQLTDIKIKRFLGESAMRIKDTKNFAASMFDCKPPQSFNSTPTQWRKEEFKETVDRLTFKLKYILRDKNCYFAIAGNPLDVKLLDDVNWAYGADAKVGGVQLNYSIGLASNNSKFYVVSTERIPQGEMIMIVIPTTAAHITYKHFEYQFIISNQYRVADFLTVPSVMVSHRTLTDEVIPIQGRIKIKHNEISSSEIYTAS